MLTIWLLFCLSKEYVNMRLWYCKLMIIYESIMYVLVLSVVLRVVEMLNCNWYQITSSAETEAIPTAGRMNGYTTEDNKRPAV